MPIQILPPRLANQIAAGEVVERPASVVKELLENSLDAGADNVVIDIERGGHKLIRIRDNGCGIEKQELTLALSRHATSKVSSLDDLEAIVSLGFRGEALASISSVARLTLTSRPAEQAEAWQAYAEGREMDVKIQPASHPPGTTLEVRDLFFNTPARRRFLRTEKTEFQHIDEVIRRIALSRFDVSLQLKHNGKLIRNYRQGLTRNQQEQRIAAVLGRGFMENALHLDVQHHGMHLHGWVCTASGARPQPDQQYSYVNGRMMRDKVLQHAVRQAYADFLGPEQCPAYLLYLELDPHEVDVNVHPAKHEVRFHQSRLVHDFMATAVLQALASVTDSELVEQQALPATSAAVEANAPANYQVPPLRPTSVSEAPARQGYSAGKAPFNRQLPSPEAASTYQALMTPLSETPPQCSAQAAACNLGVQQVEANPETAALQGHQSIRDGEADEVSAFATQEGQLRPLSCYRRRYLLVMHADQLQLIILERLEACLLSLQLQQALTAEVADKPLLMPIRIPLQDKESDALRVLVEEFAALGIEIRQPSPHKAIIQRVPALLRHTGIADWLPELLAMLSGQGKPSPVALLHQVAGAAVKDKLYSPDDISSLIKQAVGHFSPLEWQACSMAAPIDTWIESVEHNSSGKK